MDIANNHTLPEDALDAARKAAGGNVGIARALGGITPQAISQWRRVPAERVLDVERITGIPRSNLRPDLYPPADDVSDRVLGELANLHLSEPVQ